MINCHRGTKGLHRRCPRSERHRAPALNYEYDPATDKWTEKKGMPQLAHHAALAAANGKIYVIGGFVPPKDTQIPTGGAWEPIADTLEYDPGGRPPRLTAAVC